MLYDLKKVKEIYNHHAAALQRILEGILWTENKEKHTQQSMRK